MSTQRALARSRPAPYGGARFALLAGGTATPARGAPRKGSPIEQGGTRKKTNHPTPRPSRGGARRINAGAPCKRPAALILRSPSEQKTYFVQLTVSKKTTVFFSPVQLPARAPFLRKGSASKKRKSLFSAGAFFSASQRPRWEQNKGLLFNKLVFSRRQLSAASAQALRHKPDLLFFKLEKNARHARRAAHGGDATANMIFFDISLLIAIATPLKKQGVAITMPERRRSVNSFFFNLPFRFKQFIAHRV